MLFRSALGSVSLPEEDQELIKRAQRDAINRDPTMAAASVVGATADAMRTAAGNEGGAMAGFMGMGMAQNAGGVNAASLFQAGAAQQAQQPQQSAPAADTWTCSKCGKTVSGNFCPECGEKKPQPVVAGSWKCGKCGTVNTGKFCSNCGEKMPEAVKCPQCGWTSGDPASKPKFCPECGHKFE